MKLAGCGPCGRCTCRAGCQTRSCRSCLPTRTNTCGPGPCSFRSIAISRNWRIAARVPRDGGRAMHRQSCGLYLASAMQRIPAKDRWTVLEKLTRHAADASDHNLPLMYWYAAEPLAEADPERALAFGLSCGKTCLSVRTSCSGGSEASRPIAGLPAIVRALEKSNDTDEQLTMLKAVRQRWPDNGGVKPPAEWATVYRKISGARPTM